MNKEYYFISDLHIGGDAELDICDFEPELIEFLKELEKKDINTELIIVGDVLGFWELTGSDGIEKLEIIAGNHRELFDQFRKTGEKITIIILPGNHDYSLACKSVFIEALAEYNLRLEPREHIIREVAGKKIWIEHGSQHDSFNRSSKFGDPYVTPIGYYVTNHIVSTTGRHATFGKSQWLKDLESVQPLEHIPDWFLSNYYYREMSPILRWIMLPFLLLFTVSLAAFVGMILEQESIIGTSIFNREFLASFGIFGKLFGMILMVDFVVIVFLIILAIPLGLIFRDIVKTLRRFGLKTGKGLDVEETDVYTAAAREIFARDSSVVVYIFGHTHNPFLKKINGRVIINTGTWLKRLIRIKSWNRLMPDIYYPTFCLNYFRISEEAGRMVIEYQRIPRDTPSDLTLLQRVMILGRKRSDVVDIPARTVLGKLTVDS